MMKLSQLGKWEEATVALAQMMMMRGVLPLLPPLPP